jgi:hypothetical protein
MFTTKKTRTVLLVVISAMTCIAAFVVAPSIVSAAQPVPNVLNYQGKLTDPATGQPIPNGAHTVTFRIYDAETNGVLKGGPYLSHVTTQNGIFNADIGPIDPAVFDGSERWLELEVDREILSPASGSAASPTRSERQAVAALETAIPSTTPMGSQRMPCLWIMRVRLASGRRVRAPNLRYMEAKLISPESGLETIYTITPHLL